MNKSVGVGSVGQTSVFGFGIGLPKHGANLRTLTSETIILILRAINYLYYIY